MPLLPRISGAVLLAALLAGSLTAIAAPAVASGPVDTVLARPARPAVAPERAMLFALTRAGTRLVAVGEHGVVALSDDDGAHWRNASRVPVDVSLTAVRFADARTGWALGHLGLVLRSDDGGETWRKQLDGRQAAQLPGATAQEQSPDKPLFDLLLDDAQHLTVIGAFSQAFHSADGGKTWQRASQRFANPEGLHLYGIVHGGGQAVVVGEQGLLLKADGPTAPFGALATPYKGSFFGAVRLRSGAILAYGLRGNAFVSDPALAHWDAAQIEGSKASFNTGLALADGSVVLGDQAGKVFISRDEGRHFTRTPLDWGAPLTGAVEAANGDLVLSSLGGIVRIGKNDLSPRAKGGDAK